MQLTKKYKIHPTEEQLGMLWKLSDACTFIYNIGLAEIKNVWKDEEKSISYNKQQNDLPLLKKEHPFIDILYSKTTQMVLRKLNANYKSFFGLNKNGDKKARPPKFKGREYFFTIPYNQSGFKVIGNEINFSHKINDVKLTFDIGNDVSNLKIKQLEIFNEEPNGNGDFFISVTYEPKINIPYVYNDRFQAIDLGITKTVTAINSKGKFFEAKNPRHDLHWDAKISIIQSRRDHCKKYSQKWYRLNSTMRTMTKKKTNQIKDWQHKLSKSMVENTKANTIIIGDLNVKKMGESKIKALNRSTQNNGYLSRFIELLTYKAELKGKKVVQVDESYTSKTCYVCGQQHNMPLSERTMKCDCGNIIDRDRNSAINIIMRYLSNFATWTGYEQFAHNLRQTGLLTFDVSKVHPMNDIITRKNLHA
ncbi:IS200/IS605 family element transposase accessory protein TnpB [Methanococcoides sp. SA1]|nr:IS200/IS605 family element transposase accessory protein TnpB [Methanococcoides sp. SA1]